jgi:hypothetical protein
MATLDAMTVMPLNYEETLSALQGHLGKARAHFEPGFPRIETREGGPCQRLATNGGLPRWHLGRWGDSGGWVSLLLLLWMSESS